MKDELADECDYSREAQFLRRYHSAEFLGQDSRFKIPWVWEGSTDRVLVMEHMDGISVGELSVSALPQEERDEVRGSVVQPFFCVTDAVNRSQNVLSSSVCGSSSSSD